MSLQAAIVMVLVPLCAAHALWRLGGVRLRRAIVQRLRALPLPARWRSTLQRDAATPDCGDACGGCSARADTPQPIRIVRGPR